jgi:hypothetical protein
MLSIVTPTIWAYEPFTKYLEQIIGHDCIGEAIIIDNRVESRPEAKVLNHPKVRILPQEKNIFVNPAWNLGVKEAKYENICFLSDDVIADSRVFYEADKFLINEPDENMGLLCGLIGWEPHNQPKVSTGEITIEKMKDAQKRDIGLHGAFALFFVRKSDYIEIPEQFKIIHGDAYLINVMNYKLKKNHYVFHNYFFHSPFGVSCEVAFNEPDGNKALDDDLSNWKSFWDKFEKSEYTYEI